MESLNKFVVDNVIMIIIIDAQCYSAYVVTSDTCTLCAVRMLFTTILDAIYDMTVS